MAEDLRPFGDPGSDAFRVNAYPFYLLNRAVSRYNIVIEAELRTIGIDIPTWRVLMILGEHPLRPTPIAEVAKTAVINISTMTRILERMTKAGLVDSVPSGTDGRVTCLRLTALGEEKLIAARGVTAPFYRKLIRRFSARDFAKLLELLNRLHDNLD